VSDSEIAPTLLGLVVGGEIDAELAALVWLLTEHGVPLVSASPDRGAAQRMRAAFSRAARATQPGLDALPGGTVIADSLEDVLRLSGSANGRASSSASGGEVSDAARDLGLVIVRDAGHVTSAHYIRPVERDGAGHLQRRPPALLAAWSTERQALDHFWWSITEELATRAGMERAEFEDEHERRAGQLAGASDKSVADGAPGD
jgi:hypothetical protein